MSNSGYFNTTAYNGRYLKFAWEVSTQNIANNTTTIKWTLSGAGTSSSGYYKAGNFKVVIDGKTVYTSTDRINLYDGTIVKTGTYTLSHESNGEKTFTASAQAGIYTVSVNCTGSAAFTLPTIPRSSTLNSVSGNKITDKFSAKFTKAVSNYSDTLRINVDGRAVSQKITNYTSGSTFSLSDALKKDIYSASQASQGATVIFQLITYNGSSKIGESNKISKTVVVNDSQPEITSATYADIDSKTLAITDNPLMIVRGYSDVSVTVSGLKALNGATLAKINLSIGDVSKDTALSGTSIAEKVINLGTLNLASDSVLEATLTDSRGNIAVSSVNVLISDYSAPQANIQCARRNNFYNETDLTVNALYSSIGGKNDITITAQYKESSATSYTSSASLTDGVQSTLQLDNSKAWNVKVSVADKLNTTNYILYVEKGQPIIFFDREKSSVGVNCFPSRDNSFEVDGKTIEDFIASRIQAGTVNFNCSANTMITQEITFPRAFSGKPRICLTANASSPQITHLAFVSASATGFTLKYQSTISRSPAYVNWIAVLDDNSKADSGE